MASSSSSKIDYLKKYGFINEDDKKKKKKKKPKSDKNTGVGVVVVDQDPVWQKPVIVEEDGDDNEAAEDTPQVEVDIEVKRMRRLEQVRSRRPFGSISDDGSGWISVNDTSSITLSSDISPPRRGRLDTPSPRRENTDLSPPRKQRVRNDSPSPEPMVTQSTVLKNHLSPRNGSSAEDMVRSSEVASADLSPPRKRRMRNDSSSPEVFVAKVAAGDLSPPRRRKNHDQSPPPPKQRLNTPSGELENKPSSRHIDLSPPRRQRIPKGSSLESEVLPSDSRNTGFSTVSKPRKDTTVPEDLSTRQRSQISSQNDAKHLKEASISKRQPLTGLVSGQDVKEEIAIIKKEDWSSFNEMDASISGRGAEPVYRDKLTGNRMSKDEFLKSKKKEEKHKEVKLEWGKGLSQKREAEARLQELEEEKNKPFARSRDDPELDRTLKDRVRWGDPMAHLVKRKQLEPVLTNHGDDERMKESGFIVPQDIPSHSWLRRGVDGAPNRYGIKPGRHWDGVDRSTGFEQAMFKRSNEKEATQREAYLWSVADM